MPQKCGKRVASTLRFSLVLIFLYTCALVCVIKSRYKKRANMRCPELLWAPSTSVWSRETTKRPPSPEGFFPVLPLLALLFFAMAAAPNGHTTVGCSLAVAVGCLLGCFLSERPNGVSRVVQNRLNGSKQSHMSKLRTVVRLHGDMGAPCCLVLMEIKLHSNCLGLCMAVPSNTKAPPLWEFSGQITF